jgi:hypothetical protein
LQLVGDIEVADRYEDAVVKSKKATKASQVREAEVLVVGP